MDAMGYSAANWIATASFPPIEIELYQPRSRILDVISAMVINPGVSLAATTCVESEPFCEPWKPIEGLTTIFHEAGCFEAPDGRRFDYIFPEFIGQPAVPATLITSFRELYEANDGVGFTGRMSRRKDECLRLGNPQPNNRIGMPGRADASPTDDLIAVCASSNAGIRTIDETARERGWRITADDVDYVSEEVPERPAT